MASNVSRENSIPSVLLSYIKDYMELEQSVDTINPIILSTFKEVLAACRQNKTTNTDKVKIDSVVDYINEELHMGHWSKVSSATRKAYYTSSFIKAIILLQLDDSTEGLQQALKCVDVGILLGIPLENNNELLTNSAKYISRELTKCNKVDTNFKTTINNNNKRKYGDFPKFDNLRGTEVPNEILPSLECFIKQYYQQQTPVKIQESITHWPAMRKWPDVSYILNMAGERTVPIEIGSQYSDENWSQKLMTLREFVANYYLSESNPIGYLAQHNLLDQIPELKNDVSIPEYCYTSRESTDDNTSVEINAWFGPKGTISSLHYDPKDNLLAQVYGTKLIVMFSPGDSQYLYPHQDEMLCNTARVDPTKPDVDQYPMFEKAKMFKCLLEPGDVLYIPPKWWHYVVALEKSFSVNFWWT